MDGVKKKKDAVDTLAENMLLPLPADSCGLSDNITQAVSRRVFHLLREYMATMGLPEWLCRLQNVAGASDIVPCQKKGGNFILGELSVEFSQVSSSTHLNSSRSRACGDANGQPATKEGGLCFHCYESLFLMFGRLFTLPAALGC